MNDFLNVCLVCNLDVVAGVIEMQFVVFSLSRGMVWQYIKPVYFGQAMEKGTGLDNIFMIVIDSGYKW